MIKMKKLSPMAPGQQGVALVMAMVILIILTMLGVSAIKSSSLQLKMASGVQDNTMAFQAAESGLVEAFSNVVLDPNQTTQSTFSPSTGVSALTDTTFDTYSSLSASKTPSSKINYRHANFTQTAVATTSSGAKVTLNQGVRQIVNK